MSQPQPEHGVVPKHRIFGAVLLSIQPERGVAPKYGLVAVLGSLH